MTAIAPIFFDSFNGAHSTNHLRNAKTLAQQAALKAEATNLKTHKTPISKAEESRYSLDREKAAANKRKVKVTLAEMPW